MPEELRRLNDLGMQRFADFVNGGAAGAVPQQLLTSTETSEPLRAAVHPSRRIFANRQEFGEALVRLLAPLDAAALTNDRGLWSALALFYFDQLCPAAEDGKRNPDKDYRYILSTDYRHYYRHLVRSPWQLVKDHGDNARFLLLAAADAVDPLRRHGEILEQLGSVQSIIRSRPIIVGAARLYGDPATGRPVRGAAGSGAGSARRLARVLRQLDLTFDPDLLPDGRLLEILPAEFDRFKSPRKASPKAVQESAAAATT
jgi:hypothetical protein